MKTPRFRIYGIKHKATGNYIYVGATTQELKIRFYLHTTGRSKINLLYKRSELIIVCLKAFDEVRGNEEQIWIDRLLEMGHPLLNKRKGGYPAAAAKWFDLKRDIIEKHKASAA